MSKFVNLVFRRFAGLSALLSGNKCEQPLLEMTMHEWNRLAADRTVSKARKSSNLQRVGKVQLALQVYNELLKDGPQPTIQSFNRVIETMLVDNTQDILMNKSLDDHYDDADRVNRTTFTQVLSMLGCMEEEPLKLKPNVRTFELALMCLGRKKKLDTIVEAVFQLMMRKEYNLKPSLLCWLLRLDAVMSAQQMETVKAYYNDLKTHFSMTELDGYPYSFLLASAVNNRCPLFVFDHLIPDIDAHRITLTGRVLTGVLTGKFCTDVDSIRLIRWVLKNDMLDRKSSLYWSESMCVRWLEVFNSEGFGAGLSDVAEAAMRRIIELRVRDNCSPIPRRYVDLYLRIIETEESGIRGLLYTYRPNLYVDLSFSALDLAVQLRSKLSIPDREQVDQEAFQLST